MLQLQNNINTLKLLIFFSIWLGTLFPQSYRVVGSVLNSETKYPISNVSVYIHNLNIGTITDEEGHFSLYLDNHLEENVDLHIRMIGYEEVCQQVYLMKTKIDLGEIYLIKQSLELESVHVHSHEIETNQISDILLSDQELNKNLIGNIAMTLSNQPNIGVSSFGAVTSKPVLRGYSGDRFLLTKDGNRTGDLSQSSADHAITLEMAEVTEIQIIRGPKSLMYGSNAIGGIINTSIADNPSIRVDRFIKKFFLGGESFNQGIYANMNLYIPFKNNQINLLFNNRYTSNQSSPIGELENTYSKTSNYRLGFTKYKETSYLNFIFENFEMDYGIPPSAEGHISGVDIELVKNTFQINFHKDISLFNFEQFDVKYNFIDYEHKEFENNLDYSSVALSKNTNNLKVEFKSINSIMGTELSYKQFVPSGFYWTPRTNEIDFSIYGFNEKELDGFNLLSSFRAGHLSISPEKSNISFSNLDNEEVRNRNFSYFSSSVGARKIINRFEINGWLMNTMKAPRIEELYSDGPHLGSYSYEIGEPNLNLEKIYGIETSVAYKVNSLNTSITTFYNYSPYYYQMSKMGECEEEFVFGESHPCAGADFIEWGSGSSGWLYKYQTKGVESVIKGLEFNVSYGFHDINISYDFSLVRGQNLTDKRPLSYINPDKQILILEYKKEKINYNLRFSRIHSQDRLGEFESFTPSSFLVDFVLGYRNGNHNITIQFNNILDEEYRNHLSKIKSIMPEAGRNIAFNYKIVF